MKKCLLCNGSLIDDGERIYCLLCSRPIELRPRWYRLQVSSLFPPLHSKHSKHTRKDQDE